jgi:hypothetical protein
MVMDDDGLCLIVRGSFGDDDVRIIYGGDRSIVELKVGLMEMMNDSESE